MKKLLFFVFFSLSILGGTAQTKKLTYVDENYKEISSAEFERRLESKLFYYTHYTSDTIDYKKLKFREFFGDIGFEKKKQLNKFFKKKYKLDTSKIWVIHYYDSLPVVKNMVKKNYVVINKTGSKIPSSFRSIGSFKHFKSGLRKMKERYWRIKNAELYNFYNRENDYPISKSQVKWYKDENLLLQKIFGKGVDMYSIIILHKNGNFYFSSTVRPSTTEKLLLDPQMFRKVQRSWYERYEKLKTNASVPSESHKPE